MQNIENFFKKLPDFAVKMFRTIFVSGVKSSNPSARPEKLCWPVMIVELRKGQKCLILKTIANYNKILPKNDIKVFKINLLSQETIHYSYFKL